MQGAATSDLLLPARSCTLQSTALGWPIDLQNVGACLKQDIIAHEPHDQQLESTAMTPDNTLTLTCAGAFQGRVPVSSCSISVSDLRAKILEAISAQASDPILDVKLIVSGRNLTVSSHVMMWMLCCMHSRGQLWRCALYITLLQNGSVGS